LPKLDEACPEVIAPGGRKPYSPGCMLDSVTAKVRLATRFRFCARIREAPQFCWLSGFVATGAVPSHERRKRAPAPVFAGLAVRCLG